MGRPDPAVEQDIFDTVWAGISASNSTGGTPAELAALLLSCAGHYRSHPTTPDVVRRVGWMLADRATPDLRAKLSLAVVRLADDETATLSFIDDLRLWATRPGADGTVGVTHTATDRVVAQYEFADASLAINGALTEEGSDFPQQSITDATALVMAYVTDISGTTERGTA